MQNLSSVKHEPENTFLNFKKFCERKADLTCFDYISRNIRNLLENFILVCQNYYKTRNDSLICFEF